VTNGTDTWQYVYDALGNRISTTDNGVTTNYVVDPIGLGNVVGEYDAAGNLTARYNYGFGLLSRTDALGNAAYYTFDAIGSTQQLITAAGAIANSYVYTPFGTTLKNTEPFPNLFQYVGEYGVMNEAHGLEWMRARSYDARHGTFTTPDPIGLLGGDSNHYRYVFNSPTALTDPQGMDCGHLGWSPRGFWLHLYWVHGGYRYEFGPAGGPRPFGPGEHTRTKVGDRTAKPEVLGEDQYDFTAGHGLNCWVVAFWWGFYFCGWGNGPPPAPLPPQEPLNPGGTDISASGDPNQKIGPAGYGSAGFILPDGTFAYRIDFENEATATAPAQQVVITDQLDSNLDWSSFRLTEIGFGDQLIAVPANTQYFETTVSITYNAVSFEVQITAGIDPATGKLQANFYSIDTATGLPPAVNIGFLPPENGTGRGMGYVSYTVNPKADLPDGTEIRNIALISFDGQPAIATNQVDPHDPSQGTDPTKECLNTILSDIQAGNTTSVRGITREINGDILPGVSISIDGIGPVVSDQDGYYEIMATATGNYTVVAHRDGFRDRTQTLSIAGLGPGYAVTCNFQGQSGLIPCAPDIWYALDCVNLWLYPPNPDTGLDIWTALDVINAWLYPVQ